MVSTDTLSIDRNYLGAASSCMNDIGNDDFPQILRIEEPTSESEDSDNSETAPIIHQQKGSSKVPEIRMTSSDNSISNAIDSAENNYYDNSMDDGLILNLPSKYRGSAIESRKGSNASEISISSILDEDIPHGKTNSLSVSVMTPSTSDASISHILDQA